MRRAVIANDLQPSKACESQKERGRDARGGENGDRNLSPHNSVARLAIWQL